MSITGKVINLERALKKLGALSVAARTEIMDALNDGGDDISAMAKDLSPVDTGRLRSSINVNYATVFDLKVDVGTNVEYAEAVEFGDGQVPQPYLHPAYAALKESVIQDVGAAINNAMRGAGGV